MNPEKWEAVDSMDSSSGVMVSNLPLIFAHGEPTSLSNMNLAELEVFVPFMVRCSVGEDLKTVWSQLPRPLWWPNRLPFRVPSAPTPHATKSLMVRLIERCYAFHGCQYLLQFCTSLQHMKPSIGYRFTDNRDGTTSMYDGPSGKLLVTFRNENRDYDKATPKSRPVQSQKKLLLSNHQSNSSKNDAMVRKSVADVYLCDKCDDEFLSLKEVVAHEKQCKGNRPLTPPMPSPEPEILDDEEESEEQVPFLSYLGLQPAQHTGIAPYTSPRKKLQQQHPPVIKKAFSQGLLRYDSIDITSPLGLYVMSKSKYGGKLQMPEHFVSRYERHVMSSEADLVATRERSSSRWYVVWRPRKEEQPWVHLYCFTSDQKKEKLINLQTGLDQRSRKLLSKCKKARIKLKRLAKRVIDRSTRLEGGRSVPCIDLTFGEDSKGLRPSSSTSSSSTSSSSSPSTSYSTPTTSSSKRQTHSRPRSRPHPHPRPRLRPSIKGEPDASAQLVDPLDPLHIGDSFTQNRKIADTSRNNLSLQGTDLINSVLAPKDNLTSFLEATGLSLKKLSHNGPSSSTSTPSFTSPFTSGSHSLPTISSSKRQTHTSSRPSNKCSKSNAGARPVNSVDPLHLGDSFAQAQNVTPSKNHSPSLQSIDIRNSILAPPPEDDLTCLPDSTRHSLNELSNNGVTVTTLYYPDAPDNDSYPRDDSPTLPRVSNRNLGLFPNSIWPAHSIFNDTMITPDVYMSAASDLGANSNAPQGSSGASSTLESFSNNDHSVEVIELSSDDDESSASNRSYARSKNGYSHWSRNKHSTYGRNKRCPVTNGSSRQSVPPQPISSTSFSCSSIKLPLNISNSLDGKLRPKRNYNNNNSNNNDLSVDINSLYEVFNSLSIDKRSFSSRDTDRRGQQRELLLTVDSEGCIKTPMRIDEDISFNVRLIDPNQNDSDSENVSKQNKDNYFQSYYHNNNNNNNNNINNNLLYSLGSKVNKGLSYLTSFIKSKVFESNNSLYPLSAETKEMDEEKNSIDDDDEDKNGHCPSRPSSRRSTELNILMRDECRELERRGIKVLKHLYDDERNIMTRCLAEKSRTDLDLITRRSTFRKVPYMNGQKKKKLANRVDGKRKLAKSLVSLQEDLESPQDNESSNKRLTQSENDEVTDYPGSSMLLSYSELNETLQAVDENKNYQTLDVKRPKLSRELSNLARDECKELKGMGFHPADIVGSSDNPAQLYYEPEDTYVSSSSIRRPSLLSFKSPGKNELSNNNNIDDNTELKGEKSRKVSRELSKLMIDEWKELKRANAHPSQIAGALSAQRNVRSNCSSYSSLRRNDDDEVDFEASKNKHEDYSFSLGRCSRTQERATAFAGSKSARMSQRDLLHTEKGMCVLGYTMVNQT